MRKKIGESKKEQKKGVKKERNRGKRGMERDSCFPLGIGLKHGVNCAKLGGKNLPVFSVPLTTESLLGGAEFCSETRLIK